MTTCLGMARQLIIDPDKLVRFAEVISSLLWGVGGTDPLTYMWRWRDF